jgi:hypothetical protein
LQTQDRCEFRVWDDPGTAAHRFTLRRIRQNAGARNYPLSSLAAITDAPA